MKDNGSKSKDNELGDYIIKETLGQGTFGKVKLGINKLNNKKVAIKILDKSKIIEKDDQERVFRELNIIKQLNHHNVILVLELLETKNHYFIVMEYCEGGELFHYIVKKRHLSEEKASFFFYQIISGIEYIHMHNVVHRDLKPENLLITRDNKIKIIDFGLSNYITNKLLVTPCGSPCYASPEMVSGNKYNGFMIDIWSIGIILYAMICGYLPFEDKENKILFKKILECKLEFPHYVSPLVKDILFKILVTEPKKRITLKEIKKHPFYLKGQSFYQMEFGEVEGEAVDPAPKNKSSVYKSCNTEGCIESNNGYKVHNLKKEKIHKDQNSQLVTEENYYSLQTEGEIASYLRKCQENNKEKPTNIKTLPNNHYSKNDKPLSPKTKIKGVSATKRKNNMISSILGIQSMRYPLYESLLKKRKFSNQESKEVHQSHDKSAKPASKAPAIAQKINSITIKTASININMIDPSIILGKDSKRSSTKQTEGPALTEKSNANINKSKIEKQKALDLKIYNLFNSNKKAGEAKTITSSYADSVIKTQERVPIKAKLIDTMKKSIHNTMSLSNRKNLSNFLENYHPIQTHQKIHNNADYPHTKINSLKLYDFFSPKKQKKPLEVHYSNTIYSNSISMGKKSKEIEKTINSFHNHFQDVYRKQFSVNYK